MNPETDTDLYALAHPFAVLTQHGATIRAPFAPAELDEHTGFLAEAERLNGFKDLEGATTSTPWPGQRQGP